MDSGFVYNDVEYTQFPAVISGLYPGQEIDVRPFAYYNGVRYYGYYGSYEKISASALKLYINKIGDSYASSLSLKGRYTEGDAVITDEEITINGKTYNGNNVIATGLDPYKEYRITYSLKANGKYFSKDTNLSTAGLTLVTKQPKVINVGNVIVAAESNLNDAETNVGFEWRRTDWSSDFNSNTGAAYLYNGQMEGYIRNLYAEKLWKYRPCYLSDSGKYYYGDWVGLDPTNTSYFEATVHTYDQITIEGNTALVKGYALRGTDAIKVQGFVYWKKVSGTRSQGGPLYASSVPSDAKIVEAKGQVMTATLSDLDYSSEYCYMAFVTTTEGDTFYGEEMTFQTGNIPLGIDEVELDDTFSKPITIVGYYDLNGRRIEKPQRGFYIIRYSDGSSRKFINK